MSAIEQLFEEARKRIPGNTSYTNQFIDLQIGNGSYRGKLFVGINRRLKKSVCWFCAIEIKSNDGGMNLSYEANGDSAAKVLAEAESMVALFVKGRGVS